MAARSVIACMALSLLRMSQAKLYSTNAICRQSNCINPIFPGMEDLRRLEAAQLQCQPALDAKQHMQFCKNAVYYDIALPSPKSSGNASTLQSVVLSQDNAASTMYYYHLAGMNVEGWEHRHPEESGDACTQAVWKMVCNTYFPRAEAGCKQGEPTKHLRPCKNSCTSYVQACNVECCDESVQCVFSKKASLLDLSEITISGYHDALGPSAACTGAASRKSYPSVVILLLLFFVCTTLQGCSLGAVFSHPTPTWEQVPSYWERFQYIPEGAPASKKIYNSCDLNLPAREQCTGNGECEAWRSGLKASASGTTTRFCKCFRDWADPECRTRRKSQASAFFLSVFLGFFGADQFYLNHFITGCAKLATLSGVVGSWYLQGWWVLNLLSYVCGMWWVFDIVRIGSAPIYAAEYRVAYDLPHWLYVTFTLAFFTLLGYIFFGMLTRADRFQKARSKLLMNEGENHRKMLIEQGKSAPEDVVGMPTMRSHGIPLPVNYGAVPGAVQQGSVFADKGQPEYNRFSAHGVYTHAMNNYQQTNRYNERMQPNFPEYERARMANGMMPTADYGNPQYGY